jgi:hypothetical protein
MSMLLRLPLVHSQGGAVPLILHTPLKSYICQRCLLAMVVQELAKNTVKTISGRVGDVSLEAL